LRFTSTEKYLQTVIAFLGTAALDFIIAATAIQRQNPQRS
jgi:hypothetical protein